MASSDALPTGRELSNAVLGKVGFKSGITPNMVPFHMTFFPTTAIMAGRVRKLEMDIRSFHEPLLRAIRDVVRWSIIKNFDVGGRPAWEPLSEGSLEVRAHWGNPNSSPMVWTGALSKAASTIQIWTITRTSAMIRDMPAKVWYGAIHQAGLAGSGGRRSAKGKTLAQILASADNSEASTAPIPARPFIVLQPEDEKAIEKIFIDWLGERVMHAWPGVKAE